MLICGILPFCEKAYEQKYPALRPAAASFRYWPPDPVTEGDSNNHQWQMLVPKKSASCTIFPDGSATDSYADKLAEDGAYAWTLWRPYECCPRRGQTFLGSSGG